MMMNKKKTENITNYFSTLIWLVLVALTIVSYCLGETGMHGKAIMLTLLAITMIKSQLIANYFMGLYKTKLLWRSIMFSYFVIVGGLIALAYLKGMP
ncbi:MAG: cytochrome C oxidase subunit IV family protein [Methylophilaceae bacterium]